MNDKPVAGTTPKAWDWVKGNKVFAFSIISGAIFGFQMLRMEQKMNHMQAQQAFDNEHDFAIRLKGVHTSNVILENGMRESYNQLSQIIEHCKKHRCDLPPHLAVLKPLPNYVPASAVYQQAKEHNVDMTQEQSEVK